MSYDHVNFGFLYINLYFKEYFLQPILRFGGSSLILSVVTLSYAADTALLKVKLFLHLHSPGASRIASAFQFLIPKF